jgi:hypothetical protein
VPNELDKDCIGLAPMVEKKCLVFSKRRSAHPVLWICNGLSTAALALTAIFRPGQPRRVGAPCPRGTSAEQRRRSSHLSHPHLVPCQTFTLSIVCNASLTISLRIPFFLQTFNDRNHAAFTLASSRREPVFQQAAAFIYLIKSLVYKIVVIVNVAVNCG